jgi:diguanylate cyclase (GGDEF)-like protein/PAS domain S-box-containing protein
MVGAGGMSISLDVRCALILLGRGGSERMVKNRNEASRVRPTMATSALQSPSVPSESAETGAAVHRRGPRPPHLPRPTPSFLAYLMGPLALALILALMHIGLVVHRSPWLWVGVFAVVLTTSALVDQLSSRHPSGRWVTLWFAQNAAAVTVVIYLSGWGPILVLAFAIVALENIARYGSGAWRSSLVWSLLGIAVGQFGIWLGWLPSEFTTAKGNALACMGAFILVFIIRMAAAVLEQKEKAEAQMRLSEDRFRSLIQNSSDVTIVVDEDGRCTYVSPAITQLLGSPPDQFLGRHPTDFVHEDDRDRVREGIGLAPRNPTASVSLQFRMRALDGSVLDVEAVIADQRSRPSVGGFVANVRNVSERTTAMRDLQRTQESFQVLFEQHPHPMWVYDLQTLRFLEVNQRAVENYGYNRDEFLSMTTTQIRSGEDPRVVKDYWNVECANLTNAGTWRHRTKAGAEIDVEITSHLLEFRGRQGVLVMAQDVTDRCRLERQLREHALHDTLTGLPNRTLILDRVDRLNAQAKRSGAEATVLCLNLDSFKLINEAYGHDVGDGLLRSVGDRLTSALREADTVGRLGGDEFVILAVPPEAKATPEVMAEKILDLIGSEPFKVDGHELNVTASIGIMAGSGQEGGELLQNAGIALSRAKAKGGNSLVVFAQEMQAEVDERVQLTMDLREAVVADQLEVFYQPVVNLKDLNVVGIEALVRWRHPRRGLVSPAQFIPLAEETGMISDIGRVVLRQACLQAVRWQARHKGLSVAVNVSVLQLRSDNFLSDVVEALATSHLDPGCLVLEVTEGILINDAATALTRLKSLKELGIRLAIDDFGTGYSSLSYLRQFPFDILKIDQSFVASLEVSAEAKTMVRTMIQLGRRLQLEVVAEGVEDPEQLDILRRMHCRGAQGYLFSYPMDATDLTPVLDDWSPGSLPFEQAGGGATGSRNATPTPTTAGRS